MNKTLKIVATVLILMMASVTSIVSYKALQKAEDVRTGTVAYNTAPTFVIASSTAMAVTTSSVRILATSTPTKRLAATIQPINCSPTTGSVFLVANRDVASAANTGIAVVASTTLALGDYPQVPVVQGAVQAIMSTGSCTVLVTEWRSQY